MARDGRTDERTDEGILRGPRGPKKEIYHFREDCQLFSLLILELASLLLAPTGAHKVSSLQRKLELLHSVS